MLQWNEITIWLAGKIWLLLPIAVATLLGVYHLIMRWQTLRRCRVLLAALNDSTRGRIVADHIPSGAGFAAHIAPPPEPFTHFQITYRAVNRFNMLGWLLNPNAMRQDRLELCASLHTLPRQELLWMRGAIPGRALAREAGSPLWTRHRLDFTRSEFATRGANPSALIHTFSELQTRFEPLLYRVTVLAEGDPALQVWLRGSGLNADEASPLVALIRAAGRAALLE